jgi:hypothetical protein
MQVSGEGEIHKGMKNLLDEIIRCQKADATVAAVAMVYVCIDTMAFLSMPATQTTQNKRDFITWVDNYLKADSSQSYQYRGIDVYAARCSLLHTFSAETEAHKKDPSIRLFAYSDNGPHAFNSAESPRLIIISAGRLIYDLGCALERFDGAGQTDLCLRERVAGRLPALYATFSLKE